MAVLPKEQEYLEVKLTALQQAHLSRRKRHPTQSAIRLASDHEQIRIELHKYFATYIASDADTLLAQINSVMFALRNEALVRGVTPSTRMDINLLLKWKDLIS